MQKEKITSLSDEHISWLSALDFYKKDLSFLTTRLTEIAGKNTNKEVGAEIEHFQNQLKVQVQNVDNMHHNINENLSKIAGQVQLNSAGYIDAGLVKEHDRQKEQYLVEERIINDLRQDFNRFASKWM